MVLSLCVDQRRNHGLQEKWVATCDTAGELPVLSGKDLSSFVEKHADGLFIEVVQPHFNAKIEKGRTDR